MRRKYRRPQPHKLGELRQITKFLLLPKTIRNEMRWLETATWEEECVMTGGEVNPALHSWSLLRWVSP